MKISLIIPVLNEEETIPIFYERITNDIALKSYELELLFVNDGSKDATLAILQELAEKDTRVVVLSFTRCFGKEAALMAGLNHVSGEAAIPMDVDLQDPIHVIPELIKYWQKGYSVVLAKRASREQDPVLKRFFANNFYQLFNKLSTIKLEPNVGDFRLLDRQVIDALTSLPERQLFMKGLFSWLGFSQYIVEFERPQRIAGSSKFNGWKLWNFALEGITSFSTIPLRLWLYLGGFVAFFSFLYAVWLVCDKIINGNPVPGYPSLMAAILFLGGVQLIGLGILGEYIGRIYLESKQRPRYLIEKTFNLQNRSDD